MYVCMCVCICLCAYVKIYIYIHMHVHMCGPPVEDAFNAAASWSAASLPEACQGKVYEERNKGTERIVGYYIWFL